MGEFQEEAKMESSKSRAHDGKFPFSFWRSLTVELLSYAFLIFLLVSGALLFFGYFEALVLDHSARMEKFIALEKQRIAIAFEQQGEHIKSVDWDNTDEILVYLYDGRVLLGKLIGGSFVTSREVKALPLVKPE
jgi:hypothetical protein